MNKKNPPVNSPCHSSATYGWRLGRCHRHVLMFLSTRKITKKITQIWWQRP